MNATRIEGTDEGGAYAPAAARRILLVRGAWLYVVARLVATAFIRAQNEWLATVQLHATRADTSAVTFSSGPSAGLVLLVGVLMLLDIRRRHEALLFANLGFSATDIVLCGVLPAIAGEFALALLSLIAR